MSNYCKSVLLRKKLYQVYNVLHKVINTKEVEVNHKMLDNPGKTKSYFSIPSH